MKIKMNTAMAHPRLGVAHPGQILDLPEADARPLLESGHADPADGKRKPAASLVEDGGETASMEGAPENAMQPKVRSRK
jgi:hypothetical protein